MNVNGLIIEGISGTGKSLLLEKILKSEEFINREYLSSIILTEHHTQRALEKKEREEGLDVSDNVSLLNQHVEYISQVHERLEKMSWCCSKSARMRIPYLFERFHFTHVFHYSHVTWNDVRALDEKLAGLNCRLCILTADRTHLKERITGRQNEGWQNYLKSFGSNPDEITDFFVRQQEHFLETAEKSKMDKMIINTSESDAAEAVKDVLSFWGI